MIRDGKEVWVEHWKPGDRVLSKHSLKDRVHYDLVLRYIEDGGHGLPTVWTRCVYGPPRKR